MSASHDPLTADRAALLATLICLSAAGGWPIDHPAPPVVQANDNRRAAGQLQHDTLRIALVVQMATWRPEADSGPSVEVAAFGEEGGTPQIPGPLIRVRTGTTIIATVRNALTDSTISVHGLLTRPATRSDSMVLQPGQSGKVRFAAGGPGTYFYWAVLGKHNLDKDDEREQVSGALIVDPPGGSPADRILMMNIWGTTIDSATYHKALAINGRSWPYTERLNAAVGDTVRWRVINATRRNHPMHLHGFYYRIDARGNGLADTLYSTHARRMVVTEHMGPFQTMTMTWNPDRLGNWLFHCHIAFHVVPETRLNPPPPESHDRMAHDPRIHMAGLVTGITVRPRPGASERPRGKPRRLHLFVQEGPRRGHAPRAMGFVLQRGPAPPADSVDIPGSLLVLTRGEPTDIVVINRLREPTAIHWHGIELESYSDGVAGWSGDGTRLAPSIQPDDSFTAQLTLPRAGTFIYHTHLNDIEQLTSGLYGAIVVLEPSQRFDPSTDHVFVAGWDGTDDPLHLLINGDSLPPPLELRAGVPHRLRFVNIGAAVRLQFSLFRDSAATTWRALARDGADLPPPQATIRPAREIVAVGQTADVAFLPLAPGEYRMVVTALGRPVVWTRRMVVH